MAMVLVMVVTMTVALWEGSYARRTKTGAVETESVFEMPVRALGRSWSRIYNASNLHLR